MLTSGIARNTGSGRLGQPPMQRNRHENAIADHGIIRQVSLSAPLSRVLSGILLAAMLCACQPTTPVVGTHATHAPVEHGAPDPAQAVAIPTALLRQNDYAGFARATVPAELHAQLEASWREGRTHWPLAELPFNSRLPQMLAAFAGEGAESRLQRTFDRQFAGADRELHSAANALGVFGREYLATGQGFSNEERAHYSQLVEAASQWARRAPLGDKRRAHAAVVRMAAAARNSGLAQPGAFAAHGMDASLQRIGPVLAAAKLTLADYGLDVDDALEGMQVELTDHSGDHARVRMRYTLGETAIDTEVQAIRIDRRWYLRDFIDHARAAVAREDDDTPVAPETGDIAPPEPATTPAAG